MKTLVHYGNSHFDKHHFDAIKNRTIERPVLTKPDGGLWCSWVDSENGWSQWCEMEGFHLPSLDYHFIGHLRDDAKICVIDSVKKAESLPQQHLMLFDLPLELDQICIDFEALAKEYDAIDFRINKDLYYAMYGWDCDSVLILNKEVFVPDVLERNWMEWNTGDDVVYTYDDEFDGSGKVYARIVKKELDCLIAQAYAKESHGVIREETGYPLTFVIDKDTQEDFCLL